MTKIDTATDAVERLATEMEGMTLFMSYDDALAMQNAAATLRALAAERDALKMRDEQWKQKAAAWLASPEAAKRLDGYREMGSKLAAMEAARDAARAERDALITRVGVLSTTCGHCGTLEKAWEELDAARAECLAMASQLQEAQARAARLREALARIQEGDRKLNRAGDPELGSIYEMGRWAKVACAALTEAPRHD